MEQQLQMVEFGVTGMAEVRTLMNRWKKVLAGLAREEEVPAMAWKTHRQVGIKVEDRRPGEEVLLTFLAPKVALERFLADLRGQGLEVTEEPLIPGVVITCKLGGTEPPVGGSIKEARGSLMGRPPGWFAVGVDKGCAGGCGALRLRVTGSDVITVREEGGADGREKVFEMPFVLENRGVANE